MIILPALAPLSRDSSDSSTLPRTLRARSLHLRDLGNPERDPGLPEVGSSASPSLREPPPFSAFSAALLMGDECLREDTEDTLRRSPAVDECLRLKKANAIDELLSRLLPLPPGPPLPLPPTSLVAERGPHFLRFEEAIINALFLKVRGHDEDKGLGPGP